MNTNRREDVQKILLALLVSHQDAMDIVALNKEYVEQEGEQVPWRAFGHVSLLDFLQSMPKLVHIERRNNRYYVRGVPTGKIKHVSSLVARQRAPSKKFTGIRRYKPSHFFPKTERPKIRLSAETLASVVELVKKHPKGISKDYLLLTVNRQYPHVVIALQDFEDQLRELSHEVAMEDNLVYPVKTSEWKSEAVVEASPIEWPMDLQSRSGPSPKYYESVTNHQRRLSRNTESYSVHQEQMAIVRSSSHCNEEDQSAKDDVNYLDNANTQTLINDRIKFRLEKLIQNHTNGIWCAELPQLYLQEYKVELKYTELGFNSVREFASHLQDIFHCVQPYSTGDCLLYNAKKVVPDNSEKRNLTLAELYSMQAQDDIEPMPAIVSTDTSKKLIPEGVMTTGETVGQLSVENLMYNVKPFVEVLVVEVFTPSFFWIHLRKKKKFFETFMKELDDFYKIHYEDYTIPPVVLEKGLNCACIYADVWHRGIIKSVAPDLQVTVFFYDYGTLKTYPANEIYYLDRKFSSLPAQAIPCGLINTRPLNSDQWPKEVTHQFAMETCQVPLVATIGSIDINNNSMMITLTNTLGEEDMHINDWLVEQNLAVHGAMGDCVDMSNLLIYEERNLMYQLDQSDSILDTADNVSRSTANMPLVSPQSTLIDKPLPPPPGIKAQNESSKLAVILDECLDQNATSNLYTPDNPQLRSSLQSNPFLQTDHQFDSCVDSLQAQSVIRMWRSNLELQISITKAYNGYLTRVFGRTKEVPKEIIARVEDATNNLIATLNMLAHFINNIDDVHSTTVTTFGGSNTVRSVHTYNDYKKCVPPVDPLSTPQNVSATSGFYGHTQSPTYEYHKMTTVFTDTDNVNQNPFGDAMRKRTTILEQNNNFNSTILSHYGDRPGHDTLCFNNDDLGLSDIAVRVQALAINRTVNDSKHENSDISGGIDYCESVENTPVRKETNPFKMGFLDTEVPSLIETRKRTVPAPIASPRKSRNSKNHNLNSSQQEMKANVTNSRSYELFAGRPEQDLNKNGPFAKIQPYNMFPSDQKLNTAKRNLFNGAKERTDQNRNVSCSYFTCDNSASLLGVHCSANTNVPIVLQTPFTVPTLPLMVDSSNLDDEGYLTRPCTSDILESSSSPGLTSEVESSERSATTSTDQSSSISAEEWIKTIENVIAINLPLSKHGEDALTMPNIKEYVNSESTLSECDNSFKLTNTDVKNQSVNSTELMSPVFQDLHENEQKKQGNLNISKLMNVSKSDVEDVPPIISFMYPLRFQAVELAKGDMYVFHFGGSGWLSIDEFIENFTEFKNASDLLKVTNNLDVDVSLWEIRRFDNPSVFAELDSSSLKASRDIENKVCKISMISLRSGFKVLIKLNVIDPRHMDGRKHEEGSIFYEVNALISAYKDLELQLNRPL